MALPTIQITLDNTIYGSPENGDLVYAYKDFQNLKMVNPFGETGLTNLGVSATNAQLNVTKPLQVTTEVSYDGSVNMVVNDNINPIKIVNSRFYLTSSSTYKIADRKGNLDTNIYTESDFAIETGLIKTIRTVPTLDFLGVFNGGRMPIGSYNFYFKLSDADGNQTDFISESGKVVCYIGAVNQPTSIRGGQLDENSEKTIKFRLNNIDLAYEYIDIYYTRGTGTQDIEQIKAYKISDRFKINKLNTDISITGYENHEEIDINEINIQYDNFDSVKTNENCQNISFFGNVTKDYELFSTLEKYSLLITPELSLDETIGNLNYKFKENYPTNGYEYFNPNNIYYKLSYWDEEIYRMGIVYILPNSTLSPVFNIRGIDILSNNSSFTQFSITDTINFGEDYLIQNLNIESKENIKGVFKIDTSSSMFNGSGSIKPIGIKFNFTGGVLDGDETSGLKGLKELTKGFFFVRQNRIPTIVSQGLAIATATKTYNPVIKGNYGVNQVDYFSESFIKADSNTKPILGRALFKITGTNPIKNNALLCPEANIRSNLFNNLFNSSEFTLRRTKYYTGGNFIDYEGNKRLYTIGNYTKLGTPFTTSIKTNLLLVNPGTELTRTDKYHFTSLAGNSSVPHKHLDPINGNVEEISTSGETDSNLSNGVTKIRGEFNAFVGSDYDSFTHGQVYNIFQKDYDFSLYWKDYFRIRFNDSSPFSAISDRVEWNTIINSSTPTKTKAFYRGDCYISTYAHRMIWNFIDPELPANTRIIDPYTWYKNYKVKTSKIKVKGDIIIDDTNDSYTDSADTTISYKKILNLFTYKTLASVDDSDTLTFGNVSGLTMPDSRKFKKYSELNGTFGSEKMNRPDINAVPLGHWVVFKVCSNINLALRDLDFSNPSEEAIHKFKRGFYPLQSLNSFTNLPESNVINSGISKTLSNKYYFEIPDVPFIKNNFSTRIHYSDVLQETSFKNGHRVFRKGNFQDYSSEYGALIKLVEWYSTLIAVMEHGVLMIPVNERAMMTNSSGEDVYINTDNVLPKNPKVLSNMYGSLWADSVIKTQRYVYGIDTVGKKIWRTNGENFECISDMKIQKFLNDNIKLSELGSNPITSYQNIKSHYNAFKQDVMFVFNTTNNQWHLCWSELLEKWTTRYSWFPAFSENVNNIFYTFANNEISNFGKTSFIYKHGFAGTTDIEGEILPTKWYNTQEPFEFEFVVNEVQGVHKVFNNLKIISNLAEPSSFEYEIVGESFDWNTLKQTILNTGTGATRTVAEAKYITPLNNKVANKIPAIWIRSLDANNWPENSSVLRDLTIRQHNKTKENLVISYQKGVDIKTNGRLKGNMQYVEDSWDIQIQPITFKYAYLKNGLLVFTGNQEMRIRDKYIKIRVKYDGTKYAIINALRTLFTISYS